jgi:multimeric flavodoxin WrbA
MSNVCVAIVYHSGYGHTARQAEAVKDGVEQVEGAEALLLTVEEAQTRWNDLACAAAIVFGAPTYMDLPPANNSTTGSEQDLNRLGFWLGAGAQSNADEGPELAPPESDLATARYLGRRVAKVTLQLVRGHSAHDVKSG